MHGFSRSRLTGSLLYAGFIVWVYATGPATMAEMAGGVAASLNVYRADEQSFQEGLALFRADKFDAARTAFDRSDPARRDSRVQYYVAYSYYRQGWGRVWSDNALFTKGLEALDRAVSVEPSGRVTVSDPRRTQRGPQERRVGGAFLIPPLASLEAGLPLVLGVIFLFAVYVNILAAQPDRARALRALFVAFFTAFTVKFILLDALYARPPLAQRPLRFAPNTGTRATREPAGACPATGTPPVGPLATSLARGASALRTN